MGLLLAVTVVAATPARAQEPRLVQRLGTAAADSVTKLVAAAEHDGLPGAPLTAKALEGAGRGAPASRVLQAVVNLTVALHEARGLLGTGRTPDELTAGAAALQSGVAPATLGRLARISEGRSVALPLVVLTDLVSRGVPDTVSTLVGAAWQRGISESDLLRIRETISRDIAAGVTPREAALHHLGTTPGIVAPATRPIPGTEPRP